MATSTLSIECFYLLVKTFDHPAFGYYLWEQKIPKLHLGCFQNKNYGFICNYVGSQRRQSRTFLHKTQITLIPIPSSIQGWKSIIIHQNISTHVLQFVCSDVFKEMNDTRYCSASNITVFLIWVDVLLPWRRENVFLCLLLLLILSSLNMPRLSSTISLQSVGTHL